MMSTASHVISRVSYGVILAVLLAIAAGSVFPILHILAVSLSDKAAASAGKIFLLPVDMNFAAYSIVFDDRQFFQSFAVSVERVLLGGWVNFAITLLMAYPLSREKEAFSARNVYMWFIIFTMLFSGGLIPWYMAIKQFGMINSIWALVLPTAVPVFNVILLMNFFRNLPKELDDAASIDGAGPWYSLMKLYIPLSLPAIATVTLFSIVSHWNAFFDGLILINVPHKQPLQTYLNQIVVQMNVNRSQMTEEDVKRLALLSDKTVNSAKIFIALFPIAALYPFLQRYFIHGITLGSVKE